MYRLFLTIFFWFWLTAWGIGAILFLGSHLTGVRQMSAPNMYATVAPILAAQAVKAYEAGGPEAFAHFSQSNVDDQERQLFLLDGFYKDVLSRPLTNDGLRAAHAAKDGQLIVLAGHIAAYKFVSSSGRPYILMLYLKSGLRQIIDKGQIIDKLLGEGLPYTISLILLVTLLCFALAYYIASPIHSIQSTARRVAQGDLKARVPPSVSGRFDELAALAKDFDSMVGRLDLLIQTQRNLLNSVSHELRSPLARINLSLEILKKHSVPESDDTFQRLDRDVARIDLLMGQLLTLSRLESGLSSAGREEVNFAQLLEETAADSNFAELMLRSCWRSIEPHRNRSHFSLSGTMVRAFPKTLSRQSFNPFSESTKTRKHQEEMGLAWLLPRKRFGCTVERYGPRILFPLGSKSRFNCQRHMKLRSTRMSCQNQSAAARYDSR